MDNREQKHVATAKSQTREEAGSKKRLETFLSEY